MFGMIAGAVYQATTAGADTRMWSTLPKRFLLARIEIKDKPIKIFGDNDELLLDAPLKENKNMIIFVKKSTPNAKVINETIYF